MSDRDEPLTTDSLLRVFGGWKGLFDGALPTTVFVLLRFVVSLDVALVAAVAAGLLVVGLRRAQGESLQQAFSGFLALLVAVLIARSTGSGKGIFLPGILITAGSGVVFAGSLLVKRPAIALGLAAVDPRYQRWRTHEPLRRACTLATAAWAASFFVRAGVAGSIYAAYGDSPADNLVLLIVINAVKWPLIVGCAVLTVTLVRRAGVPAEVEARPAA